MLRRGMREEIAFSRQDHSLHREPATSILDGPPKKSLRRRAGTGQPSLPRPRPARRHHRPVLLHVSGAFAHADARRRRSPERPPIGAEGAEIPLDAVRTPLARAARPAGARKSGPVGGERVRPAPPDSGSRAASRPRDLRPTTDNSSVQRRQPGSMDACSPTRGTRAGRHRSHAGLRARVQPGARSRGLPSRPRGSDRGLQPEGRSVRPNATRSSPPRPRTQSYACWPATSSTRCRRTASPSRVTCPRRACSSLRPTAS